MGNKTIKRKTQSEWKIQLTMTLNFVSTLPDSNEIRIMHAKSDNIEIIMGSETNEIMEKLFKSIQQRYKNNNNKRTTRINERKSFYFRWCKYIVL